MLNLEQVKEPCLLTSTPMKREFFQFLAHRQDIYEDAPRNVAEAFIRAGANLCPQFIMPSPLIEHLAENPFRVNRTADPESGSQIQSPEDVRDYIKKLQSPGKLENNFDIEKSADDRERLQAPPFKAGKVELPDLIVDSSE